MCRMIIVGFQTVISTHSVVCVYVSVGNTEPRSKTVCVVFGVEY